MEKNVKDLKKLNRRELFEIILEQVKRINELEETNKELEDKLKDRKICISESGSLAEAALKLSGIFETADKACKDYLEDVNKNLEIQERERVKENRKIKRQMIKETEVKCQKMIEKAQREIDASKQSVVNSKVRDKKNNKSNYKKINSSKKGNKNE